MNSWLCQAWLRQNPTAKGPSGDYQVGHHTQTGEPAWASEGELGPSKLLSTPSPTLVGKFWTVGRSIPLIAAMQHQERQPENMTDHEAVPSWVLPIAVQADAMTACGRDDMAVMACCAGTYACSAAASNRAIASASCPASHFAAAIQCCALGSPVNHT